LRYLISVERYSAYAGLHTGSIPSPAHRQLRTLACFISCGWTLCWHKGVHLLAGTGDYRVARLAWRQLYGAAVCCGVTWAGAVLVHSCCFCCCACLAGLLPCLLIYFATFPSFLLACVPVLLTISVGSFLISNTCLLPTALPLPIARGCCVPEPPARDLRGRRWVVFLTVLVVKHSAGFASV